jgi:hypothetical protein
MAATYIRNVFNELHGRDTDYPLSIPIGIDSQSAVDNAQSTRETQHKGHATLLTAIILLELPSATHRLSFSRFTDLTIVLIQTPRVDHLCEFTVSQHRIEGPDPCSTLSPY